MVGRERERWEWGESSTETSRTPFSQSLQHGVGLGIILTMQRNIKKVILKMIIQLEFEIYNHQAHRRFMQLLNIYIAQM